MWDFLCTFAPEMTNFLEYNDRAQLLQNQEPTPQFTGDINLLDAPIGEIVKY